MQEQIKELRRQMMDAIGGIHSKEDLADFWQNYLGKNGQVAGLMKNLRSVAKEERPTMGKLINELKTETEARYQAAREKMEEAELAARDRKEQIDITMPAKRDRVGNLHPLTLTRNEMVNVFSGMGFEIYDGAEIEDDDHNFTRLNVPKNHPSRDMQDTFYITEDILLRTQTSTGQIRYMDAHKPPIKMLSPGRVFRSDSDATHSPMFSQMEGLVVDKHITLGDLQGMLEKFCQQIFGESVRTRLRPSYFPFTEPSAEMDISCFICGGEGCGFCKHTGWVEILGCGMVDPNVLELCGIDSKVYSGYAFGMGVERITNLKYQVSDLRMFSENDVRFLKEFESAN
jgi:phenylalanyl-tRNA synthetase alpha chain